MRIRKLSLIVRQLPVHHQRDQPFVLGPAERDVHALFSQHRGQPAQLVCKHRRRLGPACRTSGSVLSVFAVTFEPARRGISLAFPNNPPSARSSKKVPKTESSSVVAVASIRFSR